MNVTKNELVEQGHAADILDKALTGVPYNSATQILEYFAGETVPAPMGMSCAFQAFWVGAELERRCGRRPEYFRDGRHRAAVAVDGDVLTVLDPYLLHQVPLRLARHDAGTDGIVKVAVPAYPVREAADGRRLPSRVQAKWDVDTGALRLTYSRYSPRRDHFVIARAFAVAEDPGLTTIPPPAAEVRPRLLHVEQNNLSVRVLHPTSRHLHEVVLPLRGLDRVDRRTPTTLVSRNNQGVVAPTATAAFERDLSLVAESVGCPSDEVVDFLMRAAATYLRAAPPTDRLAPYSLEDE